MGKRLPTQQVKRLLLRLREATLEQLREKQDDCEDNRSTDVFQKERESLVTELVDLLLPFPELIGKPCTIGIYREGKSFSSSVLHEILFSGYNDMKSIQALIDTASSVNQNLLENVDDDGNLPLHAACIAKLLANDDDVIVKLAQQQQKNQERLVRILSHRNFEGDTPFECALKRGQRSPRVLTAILDRHPPAAASVSTLKYAIEDNQPHEVVSKVFDAVPFQNDKDANNKYLKLDLLNVSWSMLTIRAAPNLSYVLPKLTRLSLSFPGGETGKYLFLFLMLKLQGNESLVEVTLHIRGAADGFRGALYSALKTNKHIEDMKIFSQDYYNLPLLETLEVGFLESTSLQRLDFEMGFFLTQLRRPVGSLGATAPMKNNTMLQPYERESFFHHPDFACPKVLGLLHHASNLTSLTLSPPKLATFPPSKDLLTETILLIIKRAHGLRSVNLIQYEIDMLPILAVLKTNCCIQHFNVHPIGRGVTADDQKQAQEKCRLLLSKHNVTLTEICSLSNSDVQIFYFLNLNRMGRAIMRNPGVPANEIVRCLRAPHSDIYLSRAKNSILPVVYGLLREIPGSWCHLGLRNEEIGSPTLPSRKRTYRELYQCECMADSIQAAASPQPNA